MPFESARPKARGRRGIAAALVLGVVAFSRIRWADAPEALSAPTGGGPAAVVVGAPSACVIEPRCAAEQALAAAHPACSRAIAQLAAYGVRWTTGDASGRYRRRDGRTDLPGTIRYGGDKAEFEDSSGNYRRVRYECDYDPGQRAVLDVRIWPG